MEISPKAISTELSISPGGGITNDAMRSPHPTSIVTAAAMITVTYLVPSRFSFMM